MPGDAFQHFVRRQAGVDIEQAVAEMGFGEEVFVANNDGSRSNASEKAALHQRRLFMRLRRQHERYSGAMDLVNGGSVVIK